MTESPARRAFVLVIDACGAGALPDAAAYGDEGTCTLSHLADAHGGLELPAMGALGLGSIVPIEGVPPVAVEPPGGPAIHGRLAPLGPGKDSITGHWELMGVTLPAPLPTYPHGFPAALVARLQEAMGHAVICNRPDNGLAAIEQFGQEHLRGGALILYTSQDSVLQLAAHTERVTTEELYEACRQAREVMSGPDAVGRVIARPFTGEPGSFARTPGRRDFALAPVGRSYLDELAEAGKSVIGVGKIEDLFAARGLSGSLPGSTNAQALDAVAVLARELEEGLVFANLIETDQVYGHRKDIAGFADALREIDARVAELIETMREGDMLIVTADHGVDPVHPGTDHTREYAPLLALTGPMARRAARGGGYGGSRHDGLMADVGASVLSWLTGRGAPGLPGEPFLS
ncbi:MAG: phosphopentomutase [Solirubrobacteraceae bacterium]|jgi:phosphopentomutase|nr:phosphopentomutase [Solirubrobacterales bacterium]MEA2214630.1 phosphopentomutase [Solirubrobacteraceae bacterium]